MLTTQVTTVGYVTEEPDLAYTPRQVPVLTLSIEVDHGHADEANGNWVKVQPTRHRVKVMGSIAENAADGLQIGDRVIVVGTQRTDVWVDRLSRETRRAVVLYAEEIGVSLAQAASTLDLRARRSHSAPALTTGRQISNALPAAA